MTGGLSIALGGLGVLLGAIAVVQAGISRRLTTRRREQVLAFVERAGFVSGDHETLDHGLRGLDDAVFQRRIWLGFQAGCDLYIALVEYYLSLHSRFRFDDLTRLCEAGAIAYDWQEAVWRTFLVQRRENRGIDPPPFPTPKANARPQTRYHSTLARQNNQLGVV
jgi:hypothetical protein